MTLAKKACKDYRIPLLAVLIFVIMSLVNKNFFTPYNIFTIADSISGYGIVALGFTFILLVGQLDISFGSVIALSACIFMMMLQAEMNFLLALLAAIAVGCACGAVTGFFVATFRLSPFIVSMTMQLAYKGIALTITNQTPVSVPHPVLQAINNIKLFNIFPIVFFFFLLLCFMRFGKHKSKLLFSLLKLSSSFYLRAQIVYNRIIDIFTFLFAILCPLQIISRFTVYIFLRDIPRR